MLAAQRMVEQTGVFAAGHKCELSQISQHSPVPILAIKAEQRLFLRELRCREIVADGSEALAQFRSIQPIASVSETAEPLVAMGLRDRGPGPDRLPALAAPAARRADVRLVAVPLCCLSLGNHSLDLSHSTCGIHVF